MLWSDVLGKHGHMLISRKYRHPFCIVSHSFVLFGSWLVSSYNAFLCLPTYTLRCQLLLHYLMALSRWVNEGVWQRSHVTVVAWALLQDSFHTTLSLHHRPHTIATAVLYLSLHCCKLEVSGGRFAQRQWWEVFSPETSEQTLQDIACKIMSVSDMSQDSGSN